ncbi:hypothetical protein GDO81_028171 [Engystomops pustulosus]|uniref:UPAR/Ly6 domain-containing protein n=1 Tax=Engystomops pustulosus TaxID=76066 RepID=A0AAV6ZLT8_ENGPU|nr:hypothetical protein GDO81_028171 [Engystomops pustulosus]
MASLVKILCLLSALTATSSALSCTVCASATSSSCSGNSITCPSGSSCGSTYTVAKSGGTTAVSLIRACTLTSQCSFNGSISMVQATIKTGISCCDTDNCTPILPTVPTPSSNSNGVTCRSCITADSTWCYTSDTIQCTGDENMCLLQSTEISGELSTAIRGCSTKSFCDLGSQSTSVGGVTTNVKFICTSGGMTVHKVLFTPVIVCLLLLKVF